MNRQRRRIWGCTVALVMVSLVTAQTIPTWSADVRVGSNDWPTVIGTDAAGNTYVAGPSRVGPGGEGFGVLVKYDPHGALLWTRTFDGNFDGAADAMVVEAQGTVTIAGQRKLPTEPYGYYPYHVTRFDADGAQLWAAEYDRLLSPINPDEYRAGLAVDRQGNAILVGSRGTNQLTPSTQDWFVVKFGEPVTFDPTSGHDVPTLLWEDVFDAGPYSVDTAKHVVVDDVDDVYVTGVTGFMTRYPDPPPGPPTLLTKKYRGTDGQVLWTDSYPGALPPTLSLYVLGPDLALDGSGALYVASTIGTGVVVRKLDSVTGAELWARNSGHYVSGLQDEAGVIRVMPTGGVVVAGTHHEYDPNTQTSIHGYAALRYDADGALLWQRTLTSDDHRSYAPPSVAVTRSGDVAFGGDTFVAPPEDYDPFVTMCDGETGAILWHFQQGGPVYEWDWTGALAVDPWDNIVAAAGIVTASSHPFDWATYEVGFRTMKFGNAQPGTDVEVTPAPDATLTFDQVIAPLEVQITYSQDPPEPGQELPPQFELGGASAGGTPTYINIEANASAFTGSVELAFQYDETLFADESAIQLLHYENGQWVDITTLVDIENDVVYGVTTSFSPFAIVQAMIPIRIDIKPGSDPNTVNLGSNGVLQVAIMGGEPIGPLPADLLDVRDIDPMTIELANATVRLRGNGSPQATIDDIDDDGHDDLVVHVITDALQLTPNSVQASLIARLTSTGGWIRGVDSVRVVQ